VHTVRAELLGLPLLIRWTVLGGASAVIVGAIAGLIGGIAHDGSPQVWLFAEFEGGILIGVAGAILGFFAAVLALAGRGIARLLRRSP
jgi:membrane associated rhomboid family serine protease